MALFPLELELKTRPRHLFDFTIWWLIRFIWEPFSGKRSHWWHWRDFYSIRHDLSLLLPYAQEFEGSKKAGRRFGFWRNLFQTNFGWQQVIVFRPLINGTIPYEGTYQIGFKAIEENMLVAKMCTLVLQDFTAVLRGPYKTSFFAVTYPGGTPLSLHIEAELSSKDELLKNVLLI